MSILVRPERPRMGKYIINHEEIKNLLNLPDDVEITSIHTVRGHTDTAIYLKCDRFDEVPSGNNTPEMTYEEILNRGTWDPATN